METADLSKEKRELLQQLFPNCIQETEIDGEKRYAIDVSVLESEINLAPLGNNAEKYQFTWPGKNEAKMLANSPIRMCLRPCIEESVDFDTTKNVFIKGDNLDALKLLRETYYKKVKMIYIDPPYNTGNDLIYNDNFTVTAKEYDSISGDYDSDNMRLEPNLSSNGRFHSDWLSMMYPRLKLARDLLTDDGVIFISIDDNECHNLKKICDEIFGNQNFVSELVLVNNIAGRSDSKHIATAHEYILVYQKSDQFVANGLPLSKEQLEEYKYVDSVGKYRLQGLRKRGSHSLRSDRPNLWYPIYYSPSLKTLELDPSNMNDPVEIVPKLSDGTDGCWRWGKDTFNSKKSFLMAKLVSGRNEYDIFEKVYLETENGQKTTKMKSFLMDSKYTSDTATTEYNALMEKKTFTSPKAIGLLMDLLRVGSRKDSIVMDFFAGSGTLGVATMELNQDDGGNRQFILVQARESDEKADYFPLYQDLCAVSLERLSRSAADIKKRNIQKTLDENQKQSDLGIRVFKIDTSNMENTYYAPEETTQTKLDDLVDNVKKDRKPIDLLIQTMLECTIPLSADIREEHVDGHTVFSVNGAELIACFDQSISEKTVEFMAKNAKSYAVIRDGSIDSDSTATNFEQIFKTYNPKVDRRVI